MRKIAEAVPHTQIVTFRIGSEVFGLDVFSVHEVLHYQPVTRVPHAPDFIDGVTGVRGSLIPVIDLRRRFEVAEPAPETEARILVVDHGGERLGLVVDEVLTVRKVPEADVSQPPDYFRGLSAEFVHGIARVHDRLIILIDMDRVLSSEERIALYEADLAPGTSASGEPPSV